MGDVRELVRNFVLDNFILDPNDHAFTDETDLQEIGVLDSLAALKFIAFVQSQFAVKLPAEDLASGGIFSVASMERLVQSLKSKGTHKSRA